MPTLPLEAIFPGLSIYDSRLRHLTAAVINELTHILTIACSFYIFAADGGCCPASYVLGPNYILVCARAHRSLLFTDINAWQSQDSQRVVLVEAIAIFASILGMPRVPTIPSAAVRPSTTGLLLSSYCIIDSLVPGNTCSRDSNGNPGCYRRGVLADHFFWTSTD